MENTEIIRKCNIVRTKFCIGLYLYVPKKFEHNKYISVQKELSFDNAIKIIKTEMGDRFPQKRFKYNHLYQVTDKRIYTVFWDKYHAGYAETNKIADFINVNNIKIRYVRTYECDYQRAVSIVTQLSADVGKSSIFLSKSPVSGAWYKRKR